MRALPASDHPIHLRDHRACRAWLVFACLILCIQLITGCAQVAPVDDQTIIEAFPFLRDGQTKKQEVLDGLGVPGNQYEEGRIITYQVGKDRSGRWSVGFFRPGYSLVLIFRMDEVLERHSLVRIMTNPSF